MCILPNFAKGDLTTKADKKQEMKKADPDTVEIIVPDRLLLNSR
jgi:hypothetical protein